MHLNVHTERLEKFVIENAKSTSSRSIKQLKPNLNSHFKQGYFDVLNSEKYADNRACIYRSSLEFKFMAWLEACPNVTAWVSEPFSIPYMIGDKNRTYSIDFIVLFDNGKLWFVEVKPYKQTVIGSPGFEINKKKWNAAINWCIENNDDIDFKIITERFRTSV